MKCYKRVASAVMGMAMAASCMAPITAYAMEDTKQPTDNTAIANHPNNETMLHSTPVYRIGAKSFYKVNDDGSVVYADQDAEGYTAVPAAYITGSRYNDGEEYGVYTTKKADGTFQMHYVKISDCQQTQGGVNWNHGTADEAKVSDDTKAEGTDTATNEDPTMSTQFYIYLDNDTEIPPETPPTEEEHSGMKTDDGRVEYDITVATVNHVNMKATVPLYVCMYGFRSTGNVVTPTKDAYQLRNYSTIDKNSRTYIADIVKVTHYSRIYDADHSNDELFSIAYDATSKTYTYWYSDPSTTPGWQQPAIYKTLADEHINASGECYVIYIDGEWDFKAAGTLTGDELRQTVKAIDQNHQLSQDFIIKDGDTQCNFGKAFAVGDSKTDNSKREGLAIKVSELQAEPATWRVVPMVNNALKHGENDMSNSALKRGEIAMSIAPASAMYNASAIDLSTCSAPLDITENGWFIAGAEKAKVAQDGAGTNAVKHDDAPALPLITTAKIAGSNVNDAGCTPVVRVTYSIIPMFETGDTQTATAGGVSSNR